MEKIILNTCFDNFDEFKQSWIENHENGDIEDITDNELWESYRTDVEVWQEEVEDWLDKKLDGVIIAFADLGFWDGRRIGARRMGTNLNSIINHCSCDNGKWIAGRYDIKADLHHHDGTHHLTFRLMTYGKAELALYKADCGTLSWDWFRKNSKSIKELVKENLAWE